ncbi:MAG: MFS transporter [Candidatus Magasanikbacteria bacterium]|nr:MFS transporter [Candidatus Magasanikbacteria bacterium]
MSEISHSFDFRVRRVLNWLPLGLAYALLYMGRYNLTVAQNALGDSLMSKAEFGTIFGVGAWVYALSFIVNGPLTDRFGGRCMMLVGVFGAIVANSLMGLVLYGMTNLGWSVSLIHAFTVLYAVNMYFQSFGAVAIVTTKAPWFHVSERGTFSTIFGVLIALGIFFAFDWGFAIVEASRAAPKENLGFWAGVFGSIFGLGKSGTDENWMIFFVPSALLSVFWVLMFLWLRNTPGEAGHKDFHTGEERLQSGGKKDSVFQIFRKILKHPVLRVVCIVEFMSGVLRNGVMHWYPMFAKELGFKKQFWVSDNWGLALLIAGLLGGIFSGWCSDRFFQSRRAPMATILYGLMLAATGAMVFSLDANWWFMGIAILVVSMSVIGVHGIFSGTATADFAGAKNTGAAVGIVDGMVYLGTGLQSLVIGGLVPSGQAAKDPANWIFWPVVLIPAAFIGLWFASRIWHAKPRPQAEAVASRR